MYKYSDLIKIVESEDIDQDELDELSKHKHYGIRYRVARHNNTSPKVLSSLINDEFICVRYEVAKNKNTELKDLIVLLKDKSSIVVDAAKTNLELKTGKDIVTPITTGIRKIKLITDYF